MIRDIKPIVKKFRTTAAHLPERARRLWAAMEAHSLGYGGVSAVSRATGICRRVIHAGLTELRQGDSLPMNRVRRPGGGRKPTTHRYLSLPSELEKLVEPLTRGDFDSPLRWTCKSISRLAEELSNVGIHVGRQTVATQLRVLGYSLQANRKSLESKRHPDRNAQFEQINATVKHCLRRGIPVISVDTRKRRFHGARKNGDFVDIGSGHDASTIAVAAIRTWWKSEGRAIYPGARRLLIVPDSGAANGARLRLWKWELQHLANEFGLTVSVCHLPPGTSKWNKIERHLFSFTTRNRGSQPQFMHETVLNLISRTKTISDLAISYRMDRRKYPAGRKVTAEEWKRVNLHPTPCHGEWNYELRPSREH